MRRCYWSRYISGSVVLIVTETSAHDMIYTECGRLQYKEIWVENELRFKAAEFNCDFGGV